MTTAPLTAGLASQPHQGLGARFVRRLGGAVRSIVSGGITLAGGLRRPATPIPSRDAPDTPNLEASVPPSRPRRAPAAAPLPQSLSAMWLMGAHRRRRRRGLAGRGDATYLPEVYAGLSPEARAFLTTPMEECDPATLDLLFSTFAQHIADAMASGSGFADPKALFAKVCGCFDAAIDHAEPNAAPAVSPQAVTDAAPATATDAAPEALADAAPATPTDVTPAAPTDSVPDALRMPVAPVPEALSAAPATTLPDEPFVLPPALTEARAASVPGSDAFSDIAPWAAMPDGTGLPTPDFHRQSFRLCSRTSCHGGRSPSHHSRTVFGGCRPFLRRGSRHGPQNPPTRRLCYAACAGPPTGSGSKPSA